MNIFVFHSKQNQKLWISTHRSWLGYNRDDLISEFKRFMTSEESSIIKQEIRDLSNCEDLSVSIIRAKGVIREVKRDLRCTFRALGLDVVGNC